MATTAATTPDVAVTAVIQQALVAGDLTPREHLLDAGSVDAEVLVESQQERGIEIVGPVPQDTSWQARMGQGYDVAHFAIAWEHQSVTCPQGQPSQVWGKSQDLFGNPVIHARFAPAACSACPVRSQWTQATRGPRALKLRSQKQHDALPQGRQYQTTTEFTARYRVRAGVEGTLAQGTGAFGLRRTRYIGQAKTHLQHLLTAVALNLARFVAWVQGMPLAPTRTSAFAALAQT